MTKRTKLLPKKEEEQHEHGSKFCNKIFDIGVNFIEEWDRSGFSIGMAGSKRQNTLMQPRVNGKRVTHTHTHATRAIGWVAEA